MFRRITLVTLALALMTTLTAPVAWGQLAPAERASGIDPNGQPSTFATNLDLPVDLPSTPAGIRSTLSQDTSTKDPRDSSFHETGSPLDLLLHFLSQMLFF